MKKLITTLMLSAMSFGVITSVYALPVAQEQTPATTKHLKKDGTPDRRYKENKGLPATEKPAKAAKAAKAAPAAAATPAVAATPAPAASKSLKKDGTPDLRKKENKAAAAAPAADSKSLKKDGTPDMRKKENKPAATAAKADKPAKAEKKAKAVKKAA